MPQRKTIGIISVAENYRLARIQRTRSWAIAQGRIGEPRMFFWVEVGEALGKWGWRNFKMDAGGGWALDGGVHFTDLMRLYSRSGSRGSFMQSTKPTNLSATIMQGHAKVAIQLTLKTV